MNILFISAWYPYPPNNGSKLRIYNLLRSLSKKHEVTLLSFSDRPDVDQEDTNLLSVCRDVQVVTWKPFDPQSLRAMLGFLSHTPRSLVDTFSSEMAQRIQESLSNKAYDLAIISQISMAVYVSFLLGTPVLFEELELGVINEQFTHANLLWYRIRHGLTWTKYRLYLGRLLSQFEACTVVSKREKQLLNKSVPSYKNVEIIPNCVRLSDYQEFHNNIRNNTLIFTGSFTYKVNYEAMLWFLQEVLPYIRTSVSDVRVVITGDHANLPLPELSNIDLTGLVDDVRPLIVSSRISLVPILQGGGTRLKILEAMALRTPVVATSKGVEGLDVVDGEHLLIADTPQEFANAVIHLLEDSVLHHRLADNAFQLVSDKYDWEVVMPRFLDLVERVVNK